MPVCSESVLGELVVAPDAIFDAFVVGLFGESSSFKQFVLVLFDFLFKAHVHSWDVISVELGAFVLDLLSLFAHHHFVFSSRLVAQVSWLTVNASLVDKGFFGSSWLGWWSRSLNS